MSRKQWNTRLQQVAALLLLLLLPVPMAARIVCALARENIVSH
jgi:lauroyl/myristoyl acyltransferase